MYRSEAWCRTGGSFNYIMHIVTVGEQQSDASGASWGEYSHIAPAAVTNVKCTMLLKCCFWKGSFEFKHWILTSVSYFVQAWDEKGCSSSLLHKLLTATTQQAHFPVKRFKLLFWFKRRRESDRTCRIKTADDYSSFLTRLNNNTVAAV